MWAALSSSIAIVKPRSRDFVSRSGLLLLLLFCSALSACSTSFRQRVLLLEADRHARAGNCTAAWGIVSLVNQQAPVDPALRDRVNWLPNCGTASIAAAPPPGPSLTSARIGDGHEVQLTASLQRHASIRNRSIPALPRTILIFQDPHWSSTAQFNLHKALEVLFAENPSLIDRVVFLGEGLPRGTVLEGLPELIANSPDPSDDALRLVLSSYALPGYITFEWASELGVEVRGIEDPALYGQSASAWLSQNDSLFSLLVVARNESMADAAIEQLNRGKTPILFVGAGHLSAKDPVLFGRGLHVAGSNAALSAPRNMGIIARLAASGVGYIFLDPRHEGQDASSQAAIRLYRERMSATTPDAYVDFSRRFLGSPTGKLLLDAFGTTVQPSPKAALTLLRAATEQKRQSSAKSGANPKGGSAQSAAKEGSKFSFWDSLFPWRGQTKTNGKSGKKKRYFEWDYTHNDIEFYDGSGNHLGSMDPSTGTVTKPAEKGRYITL